MKAGMRCILWWCGAFLTPQQRNNKNSEEQEDDAIRTNDYYQILNVDRDADHEAIRRAYKKQSLKKHPDKIAQMEGRAPNDQDRAEFQKMKEAYDVLSDSEKRQFYDEFGLHGMKLFEDPTSIDPMVLQRNFARSSVFARTKIFLLVLALLFLPLLVPILICLKADGVISDKVKWTVLMIPLWLAYSLVGISILAGFFASVIYFSKHYFQKHNAEEDEFDGNERRYHQFISLMMLFSSFDSLLNWGCLVAFSALLFSKLDNPEDSKLSWAAVFAPIYFYPTQNIFSAIYHLLWKIRDDDPEEVVQYKLDSKEGAVGILFRNIMYALLFFLVVQKLYYDDSLSTTPGFYESWWTVFTPIWIVIVVTFIYGCCCTGSYDDEDVEIYDDEAGEEYDDDLHMKEEGGRKPGAHAASSSIPAASKSETEPLNEATGGKQYSSNNNSSGYSFYSGEKTATNQSTTGKDDDNHDKNDFEKEAEAAANAFVDNSRNGADICSLCCFALTIVLLVAKLQFDQDHSTEKDDFSAFWVPFPTLFLPASIILLCCACSIYCIPRDETEFTENQTAYGTNNSASNIPAPVSEAKVQPPVPSSSSNMGTGTVDDLD